MSRLALVQMVGSAKLVRVGTRAVSLAMADFRSNSAIPEFSDGGRDDQLGKEFDLLVAPCCPK